MFRVLPVLFATAAAMIFAAGANVRAYGPPSDAIVFQRWPMDGSPERILALEPDSSAEAFVTSASNPYPAWSPDGKKIAFGAGGLSVLNLETNEIVRISDHGYMAAWSPDGNRIAFTSGGTGGLDIWVMNADGSDQQRLTDAPGYDDNATWSADGTRIAFISTRDDDSQGRIELEIYVMNADGSGQTRLTFTGYNNEPDWSPDGSTIAFASDRAGYGQIYLMNADGSDQRPLVTDHWCTHPATPDPTPPATPTFCSGDQQPSWSPDGQRIVFTSYRPVWSELYVINSDGSDERRLTFNDAHDSYPDWGRLDTVLSFKPPPSPTPSQPPFSPAPWPSAVSSPAPENPSPTPCVTVRPTPTPPPIGPTQPMSRPPTPSADDDTLGTPTLLTPDPTATSEPPDGPMTPTPPPYGPPASPTLVDKQPPGISSASPTVDSPTPTCAPEVADEGDDGGISPEATRAAAATLGALLIGPPLLAGGALAFRAWRRPKAGQ